MNVKIQGGGKNAGVYANTGSAAALVEYLEHEDKERLDEGLDILPFFNGQGFEVERGEVLQKLDRNHKKLHYKDAKFYHLDINPSQEELRAMGATEEEIIANCKVLAVKLTQLYADNFNKDIVVGKDENGNNITRRLSGEDIMIFWKVHTTRNEKDGLQVHIHGIPSRKDIHNKYQLSPATAHRNTSKGPVTGGFERTRFYSEVERVFDETFGYTRAAEETFTYCNEQKKAERRERKIEVNVEEIKKEKREDIVIALPEHDNKIKDALARRDLRRRNEFWNEYHSKYRPMYEGLKESCNKSFAIYKDAKENYGICSEAIKEKYNELRSVYSKMNALQEDIQKASTAKGIVTALSALVFCMNPVAGIAMGLVGRTIAEAEKSASIEARRSLRSQAAVIRDSISELKTQQAVLRQEKTDKLKVYVENKEAKAALQSEISNLKAILDKKLEEPRTLKGFAERYAKHVAEQQPSAPRHSSSLSSSLAKYSRKGEILQVFKSASDENSLRLGLASHGLSMQEVSSRRGVEDITITAGGENSFTVNVSTFGQEYLHSVLEQYAAATKKKPAYKTEMELQRVQRIRPTQAINQDVARQIQQEKAREQARQTSQVMKNTVSQVNNIAYEIKTGGVKIR